MKLNQDFTMAVETIQFLDKRKSTDFLQAGEVAKALNLLGVTPRDIIAIFQALKRMGSLRDELVII